MIEINYENAAVLKPLFAHYNESLVWSYFDGQFGRAWADSAESPTCAAIYACDFYFLAGDAASPTAEELVRHIPADAGDWLIYTPVNDGFDAVCKRVWGDALQTWIRYAIKKEGDIFDRAKLQAYADSLAPDYEMRRIDEALYHRCAAHPVFFDFVRNFQDAADFLKRGVGFVAMKDGEIVGGASSYSMYNGGIEIEVDTGEAHRRRGIATACCARLILHCLENSLYPSWDAANTTSVHLAEKLGYHFDHEYTVYALPVRKVIN